MTWLDVLMLVVIAATIIVGVSALVLSSLILYDIYGPLKMPTYSLIKKKLKTGQSFAALTRDEQIDRLTQQTEALQVIITAVTTTFTEQVAAHQQLLDELSIRTEAPTEAMSSLGYSLRGLERQRATLVADRLLDEHLTDAQRSTWRKSGYIKVPGKQGIVYKILKNGNVLSEHPKGDFCIYSTDPLLPSADVALGYKLFIESNEQGFLDTANWSGVENGGFFGLVKLNIDGTPDPSRRHRPNQAGDIADLRLRFNQMGPNGVTTTTGTWGGGGGHIIPNALVDQIAAETVRFNFNHRDPLDHLIEVTTMGDNGRRRFMNPDTGEIT